MTLANFFNHFSKNPNFYMASFCENGQKPYFWHSIPHNPRINIFPKYDIVPKGCLLLSLTIMQISENFDERFLTNGQNFYLWHWIPINPLNLDESLLYTYGTLSSCKYKKELINFENGFLATSLSRFLCTRSFLEFLGGTKSCSNTVLLSSSCKKPSKSLLNFSNIGPCHCCILAMT